MDVLSNIYGERVLWASVIADAVNNYLSFGLGKNGTSVEEFYSAELYLFHIRSDKPETWEHAREFKETYFDEDLGRRVTHQMVLTDDQLRAATFDVAFSLGDWPITMEKFLSWLETERKMLIEANRQQITDYLNLIRSRSMARVLKAGDPMQFNFLESDWDSVLVHPLNARDLIRLVKYTPRFNPISDVKCRICVNGGSRKPKAPQLQPKGILLGLEVCFTESPDSAPGDHTQLSS